MSTFNAKVPRDHDGEAVTDRTTGSQFFNKRSARAKVDTVLRTALLNMHREEYNRCMSAAREGHLFCETHALRMKKKVSQRALARTLKDEGLENAKGVTLKMLRQAYFQQVDGERTFLEALYAERGGAGTMLPADLLLKVFWGGMPQFDVTLVAGDGHEVHVDVLVLVEDKIRDWRPQKILNFKFAPKYMQKAVPLDTAELVIASNALKKQCGSAPALGVLVYLSPRGCNNVLEFLGDDQPAIASGQKDSGQPVEPTKSKGSRPAQHSEMSILTARASSSATGQVTSGDGSQVSRRKKVTKQNDLNALLQRSREQLQSEQDSRVKAHTSAYEEFKLHYPDRVEVAKALIMRLERNQRPHMKEQATRLDWWEARLQAIIAPTYMEKRQRQQILRGLLRECGITGVKSSKT